MIGPAAIPTEITVARIPKALPRISPGEVDRHHGRADSFECRGTDSLDEPRADQGPDGKREAAEERSHGKDGKSRNEDLPEPFHVPELPKGEEESA